MVHQATIGAKHSTLIISGKRNFTNGILEMLLKKIHFRINKYILLEHSELKIS